MISCLSEHVRNDTLLEEKHRIDKVCRKQLRAEVLERVRFHYLILLYIYVYRYGKHNDIGWFDYFRNVTYPSCNDNCISW